MYTPTRLSLSYGEKLGIGIEFDITSFETLINFSIKSIHREISAFKRGRTDKYKFVNEIGPSMELVQRAIFVALLQQTKGEKSLKLKDETKSAIKKLVRKINALTWKLGQNDSDFCTDDATQRVSVSKEMLLFIKIW